MAPVRFRYRLDAVACVDARETPARGGAEASTAATGTSQRRPVHHVAVQRRGDRELRVHTRVASLNDASRVLIADLLAIDDRAGLP
jgi:hypothetical protein